ncbi:unnamed protein product [Amoebophrya sp. A120]|nr:unnamed protein product [Amoebophrya sp. A120]|eukprot:GSA120T00005539001.1
MMMKQLRSSCSADHPLARRAQLRLRLLLQRRTVCASPNKTASLSPVLAASQQGRITSVFLNMTRDFSATATVSSSTASSAVPFHLGTSQSSSSLNAAHYALGGAALAAGLAVVTAMLSDAIHADEAPVRPYHPEGERYGDDYSGRVRAMREVIDPRLLLTSEAELRAALSLLAGWKPGRNYSDAENDAFWQAKQLVKSMVHPVTQEVMFLPGRMSAFVPVNAPTAMGMLLHGPTGPAAAAFWQFMNQTGNAMTNYVNRSGATVDTSALFMSFASACTVSVTVALGMGRLVARNPALKNLGLFVPYVSVCMASMANLFLTRFEEWTNGVPVYDQDGQQLGVSAKAGFEGVWQTVTTRGWVTPLPILVLPPVLIMAVRRVVANKTVLLATEISMIIGCMYYFLPFTLALQPQRMTLKPEDLEERFQGLKTKSGEPITQIFANKGL